MLLPKSALAVFKRERVHIDVPVEPAGAGIVDPCKRGDGLISRETLLRLADFSWFFSIRKRL